VRYLFLLLFFLFNNLIYGQIIVDRDSAGLYKKIDSALWLIKKYDPEKYQTLDSVCSRISIWNSFFSSTSDSTILISSNDFKLNSINNIACAIVHESMHLYFDNCRKSDCNSPDTHIAEEKYCYSYEYDFFLKIPDGEYWLKMHILREIVRFSE